MDEPFPPLGDHRSEMRRAFLRRIGLALVGVVVFFMVLGWIGWAVFGGGDHDVSGRRGPFPGFFLFIVVVLVGVVALGRTVRRTARPIGDVMDAAARLREGDLSARAREHGPREIRELARSFNAMAERLETDEHRRRNLLADVTHELRTPLAVIRGRVEGVRDGVYAGDDHLALIEDETLVLARLLDDLQLLSNAEAGALVLHRERVSPSELVDSAVAAHAPDASAAGITLGSDVRPGVADVDIDRVRIGEVLANLLTNAIRHTPRGGAIVVRAAPDPAGVAFEVADTGEGISPGDLERVFDRFATSGASRGSGLGLAIARSLVRAHGGEISATSDVGAGTTLRFTLPAA
ncbi:MAG TPA: HAMP domain-containing sensor histidine kinase [Actinomycetota bacterium]|nr:HAMP domain-containing sensor histidine kinase [Actinomycetota bacterium]